MYLSHPVRRLCENPAPDETVTLRITAVDDSTAESVADSLASLGTVHERLRFAALRVTVPQDALEEVCAIEGIEAIETAQALRMDADGAGEDVVYDE